MKDSILVPPYGGVLVDLATSAEQLEELKSYANRLPCLHISERSVCDLSSTRAAKEKWAARATSLDLGILLHPEAYAAWLAGSRGDLLHRLFPLALLIDLVYGLEDKGISAAYIWRGTLRRSCIVSRGHSL